MYTGKTVFSQVMDYLPMYEFRKCVDRYNGNYHTSSFSCLDQYLCMAFAQLTYRESLRDIEACLRSRKEKLYHLGIRGRVSRSTLAEANKKRDWRMYADFCQILISQARSLYTDEDFGVELKETAYALDSTTIDLCLSGLLSASIRPPSKCILSWTFAAASPRSSKSPRGHSMMSISLTSWFLNRDLSTSWTAVTWASKDSMFLLSFLPFLSHELRKTTSSGGSTPTRWIEPTA